MIEERDQQVPSNTYEASEIVSLTLRIDDLLPRLRSLIAERRFTRTAACRYMGMHPNALQRLNDKTWHPRLDTLLHIAVLVETTEKNPSFRLEGAGWRLDHQDDEWWIECGAKWQPLGPFTEPNAALAAGEHLEMETNLATENCQDHDDRSHGNDRGHRSAS